MSSNEAFTGNEEAPTYAPSIPVPNVQELMREDPSQVPQRYVRDLKDRPKDTDLSHLSSLIPLIDFSLLLLGNEEELNKLDLACQDWGFFQKNKYAMPSDDIQGYGHGYVVLEEQILDWEIIEEYSNVIRKFGTELMESFSLIMGMEKEALLGLHKQLIQVYRVNYYPPCSKPDQVLGVSPHSDSSTITILMQDDGVCGLQIKHDNEWVPVNPFPYALVVNVGDVIEMWSNGKYKSIEHRAVANDNRARISYASFLFPHDKVEIEPLNHMIDQKTEQQIYKKVKYGDYLRNSMKRKMEGKAHTQMAKVEATLETL
ncbi:putative disease resistance protein [Hibiscus syriacus]|uniref:Disease resistance protein n=1 Tax=Hibiscus syriacus TaxID=106335 RepID=A0A6A2ZLT8_HIBSY|nr:putative disease resistance protein [Hibiscus syriacus]